MLQKDRRGDKLNRSFNLSFWRMGKGVHKHGLVDKDTTRGVERREE
jgi:hypothetical protein